MDGDHSQTTPALACRKTLSLSIKAPFQLYLKSRSCMATLGAACSVQRCTVPVLTNKGMYGAVQRQSSALVPEFCASWQCRRGAGAWPDNSVHASMCIRDRLPAQCHACVYVTYGLCVPSLYHSLAPHCLFPVSLRAQSRLLACCSLSQLSPVCSC